MFKDSSVRQKLRQTHKIMYEFKREVTTSIDADGVSTRRATLSVSRHEDVVIGSPWRCTWRHGRWVSDWSCPDRCWSTLWRRQNATNFSGMLTSERTIVTDVLCWPRPAANVRRSSLNQIECVHAFVPLCHCVMMFVHFAVSRCAVIVPKRELCCIGVIRDNVLTQQTQSITIMIHAKLVIQVSELYVIQRLN